MNHTTALIAVCLSLLAPAAAHAQTSGMPLEMDSGAYAGLGLGRSEARDFCTTLGGACDSKAMTWNLFAGYKLNRYFAVEGGYSDFGKAKTSGFVGGVASSVTSETTAAELVAVGFLPLTEQFSFYAKGGFFRYDSDGSATGALAGTSSDKGTELTFGLGAEYGLAHGLGLRLEWQRYLSVGSGILNLPKADISVVRVGARYRF
jgi:OOP family OmpA-OmpF porin